MLKGLKELRTKESDEKNHLREILTNVKVYEVKVSHE